MKFHETLINKLVKVMEVNSGWRDEKKLKEALARLNLVVYTQKTGNQVLVDADEMARLQRNG